MASFAKTRKGKRLQRKSRSRSRSRSRSKKIGGGPYVDPNVNPNEALQYLMTHFPGAVAKAEELGEDAKHVAANMLLLHLLYENMNRPGDRTPDWAGPIDSETGMRLRQGDKFRYYALFVKGNPDVSESKLHLYARRKEAIGSAGVHLASAFIGDLDKYNE
jgi:hypothetical protein